MTIILHKIVNMNYIYECMAYIYGIYGRICECDDLSEIVSETDE